MKKTEMTSDCLDGKSIAASSFVDDQNLIKKAYIQNGKKLTKHEVGVDISSVELEEAVDMNERDF